MKSVLRAGTVLSIFYLLVLFSSCGSKETPTPTPPPPTPPVPDHITITVSPTDVKQEMIGFGGGLTWYSNWVTGNVKNGEIADLMFTDLGIDIIRFKNWYYPSDYPTNKSVDNIGNTADTDYSKPQWDATNTLYQMAMERNPNIKILLSSWGPPVQLKSNGKLQEGTLLKDGSGNFVYDDFAQYWSDVLDNVPFNPDYISIQNEPTYANSGWTSCQWDINETSTLPGYNTAFNKVYDKIKTRAHVPIMFGPESQDITTFVSFSNVLKDNANCGIYAYHPYNINASSTASGITSSLQSVGSFSTKPNVLTEFSDNLDWFNTALFIQNALLYANSSGYIYWKFTWNTPTSGTDAAIISMASSNSTSAYTVTPFYYLIKHFSKYVDAGFHRVSTSSANDTNNALVTTAFINPANNQLTVVVVNSSTSSLKMDLKAVDKTASSINVYQSVTATNSYYKTVTVASPTDVVTLPAKSITTFVIGI